MINALATRQRSSVWRSSPWWTIGYPANIIQEEYQNKFNALF